jgi:hypothetical protein
MRSVLRRGPCRSRRWLRLAGYYVSVLLVLSFICFEVLDLDGSDVPVPSKSPRIKLAESHDVRRATLAGVPTWGAMRPALVDDHTPPLKLADVQVIGCVMPIALRSRLTLPRAATGDPAVPA